MECVRVLERLRYQVKTQAIRAWYKALTVAEKDALFEVFKQRAAANEHLGWDLKLYNIAVAADAVEAVAPMLGNIPVAAVASEAEAAARVQAIVGVVQPGMQVVDAIANEDDEDDEDDSSSGTSDSAAHFDVQDHKPPEQHGSSGTGGSSGGPSSSTDPQPPPPIHDMIRDAAKVKWEISEMTVKYRRQQP